jgi:2-methylcitrate dehydratase
VLFKGRPFTFQRPYGSYVMENVLFKISFPAEFHAQTAVECAVTLHPLVKDRLADIQRIVLTTHESAIRIISKTGPLHNYADRDHCLQYMVAIPLLHGTLDADHYSDATAADPRIDRLRGLMEVVEDPAYSRDYLDPDKRSIANAIQIHFKDGTSTPRIEVAYPIGHRRRRQEGLPLLVTKCRTNLSGHLSAARVDQVLALFQDRARLDATPVPQFMELFIPPRDG